MKSEARCPPYSEECDAILKAEDVEGFATAQDIFQRVEKYATDLKWSRVEQGRRDACDTVSQAARKKKGKRALIVMGVIHRGA